MTTVRDLINEMRALEGANVNVFGQPVTLQGAPTTDDFEIDICDVLAAIEDYEVTTVDRYTYDEETDEEEYEEYEPADADELISLLVEQGEIKDECDYKGDNSYNWLAPVNHHFDFKIYDDFAGGQYIEFKCHRFGDVRGNYTDSVVLHFRSEYEFMELVSEANKRIDIEVDGAMYDVDVNIWSDAYEVWDEDGSYVCAAYGDRDDVIEKIREELLND